MCGHQNLGGLAQGDHKTNTKGNNAILVMNHDDIRRLKNVNNIPTHESPQTLPLLH